PVWWTWDSVFVQGQGGLGRPARCALVRAARPLGRVPETQWHAGTLPPITRHKLLDLQELVSTEAACQPPLKLGRLAGWVAGTLPFSRGPDPPPTRHEVVESLAQTTADLRCWPLLALRARATEEVALYRRQGISSMKRAPSGRRLEFRPDGDSMHPAHDEASGCTTPPRRGGWGLLLILAAIQFTHVVDFLILIPLGPRDQR